MSTDISFILERRQGRRWSPVPRGESLCGHAEVQNSDLYTLLLDTTEALGRFWWPSDATSHPLHVRQGWLTIPEALLLDLTSTRGSDKGRAEVFGPTAFEAWLSGQAVTDLVRDHGADNLRLLFEIE